MAWQWWCFVPLLLSAGCWCQVRIEQDSDSATAGDSTRLTCHFSKDPDTLRWTFNATNTTPSTIWSYSKRSGQDTKTLEVNWNMTGEMSEGKTSHTIFLHNVSLDMEGDYSCEIEDIKFITNKSVPVQLTVNVPPKVYIQFKDEDKWKEGKDANKVKCIASGYKPEDSLSFSIKNYSNSERIVDPVPVSGDADDNGNKTFTQEATGSVGLSWLDRKETSLICEAQWMGITYPSKTFLVEKLMFGPKLKGEELKAFFASGSSSLFYNFSLYGDPAPTVDCGYTTKVIRTIIDEARYIVQVIITSLKKEIISCTSSNGIGSEIDFTIQVQENSMPDKPKSLTVVNKTQDSATVTWTSNHNGGKDQTFSIDLKHSGKWSPTANSIADKGYGKIHRGTLTGLDSGSVYFVRIHAKNSIGKVTSDEKQFETEVSGTSNTGIIAGVVVVVLILIIAAVVIGIVCCKRKRAAGSGTKKVHLFEMADQNSNNHLAARNGPQADVRARSAQPAQPPALPPALHPQVSSSQPKYEPPEYAVPGKQSAAHSAQRNGNADVVYTDVVTQRLSPGQKRAIKKPPPTEYSTVCFNQEVLHVSDSDSD